MGSWRWSLCFMLKLLLLILKLYHDMWLKTPRDASRNSIHPKAFFLWLGMGPTLKSGLFPSETPWKKLIFFFASHYQLEIASGLETRMCVHFSKGSLNLVSGYWILASPVGRENENCDIILKGTNNCRRNILVRVPNILTTMNLPYFCIS